MCYDLQSCSQGLESTTYTRDTLELGKVLPFAGTDINLLNLGLVTLVTLNALFEPLYLDDLR